jgi:hypothetical protein
MNTIVNELFKGKLIVGKTVVLDANFIKAYSKRADNVFQIHLSWWTVNELKRIGHKVHGIVRLKLLMAEKAKLRYTPEILFSEIADISQKLTSFFTNIAFELLCVKNLHNKI